MTANSQIYVLNTPVLTGYGQWGFDGPIAIERARQLLSDGFVSAVGHPGAAQFLSALLEVDIPANRISVDLQPEDRALVLRLKERLPEGTLLTQEQMRNFPFELGLLTRLSSAETRRQSPAGEACSDRLDQALWLAGIAHATKVRKGTVIPYLTHPFHVALILDRHGASEDLVIAGLLHDVLEDAPWGDDRLQGAFRETYPELRQASADAREFQATVEGWLERIFGTTVLELVRSVTERKRDAAGHSRAWHVRKQEQLDHLRRAGPETLAVKAADLLHNLHTTRRDLQTHGLDVFRRFNAEPEAQLSHASHVVQAIGAGLGDDALADELRQLFQRYCQQLAALARSAGNTRLYEASQEALRCTGGSVAETS